MTTLQILSKEEEKTFNQKPVFNSQQQKYYFSIPKSLLEKIASDFNQIYFTLLYGYFKATNKFFTDLNEDKNLDYIASNVLKISIDTDAVSLTKSTLYRYQQIVKQHLQINEYTDEIKDILVKEATTLANNFIHRKKIFYALVEFSKKLSIEVPSYTELYRIITVAINSQKRDILERLTPFVQDQKLGVLDEFLQKDGDYKNRWSLTHYKILEHSTKKAAITVSLQKFKTIQSKFNILESIFILGGITPKIAQYHAKWIEKSQVFQVKRKKDVESNFLLLSFVYYQYLIRNDNLIDRFISTVQTAKNSSLRSQKEFSFEQEPHKNRVMQSLENANLSTLNEIEAIVKDSDLSARNKVAEIEKLLEKKTLALREILLEKKVFDTVVENKYDFIESKSVSLQGKLTGILKAIEFDEKASNKNLIEAIKYFKNNPILTHKAPKAFLDEEERITVFDGDKFRVSLYKILLFFHVSDAIKNGTLNLKYSYRYKNFDDYMIDKDDWTKNKELLLTKHDMGYLRDFDGFIKTVEEKVEASYEKANTNILKGANTYFTAMDDSYILKTPKLEKNEDEEKNPLAKYFPAEEYLSVIDVLNSIDRETDFLSSFQHYAQSRIKSNHNLLLASILGYGCNLSLLRIGKISKGINENQLDNTKIWYFSEDNTTEANDKIVAYMEKLELVKIVRHHNDINHTSSDGQKYSIASNIDSTNAGYSNKYFGADKGVVAYTFIDESNRLFHSTVINVSERESGYVIDGLLHNETIKSDLHSGDSHSYTELIFGLTNLLGFNFGPRIKNFKDQQLYGFFTPKYYHTLGYKLTPKRKINTQIIEENWDDILRFITTIKERKTTATQLLKRLTSYSKQHKLYTALKEFGKIIKTDFLLNYIDDVKLRQRIEKQLNKVEASNRFSKAVFFGNNQEFTVATAEEQNIANNSKRLIQNAIILWNYLYLTKKLQQAKNQIEKDEIIIAIKTSSIVHWQHINFYGTYDFTSYSKRVYNLIAIDKEKEFAQPSGL
ncbi:MAG: Tn3 family transposase [Sulfurospirillaceae bacterium]|nr:Tn3 family transposase [Sulfurospirillaceae bacterium]